MPLQYCKVLWHPLAHVLLFILQRLSVHVVVPAGVRREAVLKDAHLHVVHQSAEVSDLVYHII